MSKIDFCSIARDRIKRNGIEELLQWLDTTDFYVAPASAKYHGAELGGLLNHSLCVYKWMRDITDALSFVCSTP